MPYELPERHDPRRDVLPASPNGSRRNPQPGPQPGSPPGDLHREAASQDSCPGDSGVCERGRRCIANGLDGWNDESLVAQARIQLSNCLPCLLALDHELQIRHTLNSKCQEKAPPALRVNISEALGQINLGDLGPGDL